MDEGHYPTFRQQRLIIDCFFIFLGNQTDIWSNNIDVFDGFGVRFSKTATFKTYYGPPYNKRYTYTATLEQDGRRMSGMWNQIGNLGDHGAYYATRN